METRTFQGEVHRRLVVQTSEGDVAIPVKVFITPYEHWLINPYPVVVPPGARGTESSTSVQFTYTAEGSGEIKAIDATPALLSAQPAKHEGNTTSYTLTRLASAPAGNHNVKLTVTTTDQLNPTLELNVFVPVISTIKVSPSPLSVPSNKVGQAATLRAKLVGWNLAGKPRFELRQGTVKEVGVEGDDHLFEVTVTPTAPGPMTQLLRVYEGDRLELEVPLVLRGEP
jgi:hypothetical protein